MRVKRRHGGALLCLLLAMGCRGTDSIKEAKDPREVTEAMFLEGLKAAPRDVEKRAEWLKLALMEVGLTCMVQPIPGNEGRSNVIGTLKGATDKVVVVAAHLDFEHPQTDVLDDWTGIVMMVHLARALSQRTCQRTWKFVGFDMEDEGSMGSLHFVAQISPEKRSNIMAAVNLDCLAMSELRVCSNFSTDALEVMAESLAAKTHTSLQRRPIWNVTSDAESFLELKIPTIVFDGIDLFELIDVFKDRLNCIKPKLMRDQYLFLYQFLVGLDGWTDPIPTANDDAQPKGMKKRSR